MGFKIRKHWKCSNILGELHRAKKIPLNFQKEVQNIKGIFHCDFTAKFNNKMYNNNETNEDDERIIPP